MNWSLLYCRQIFYSLSHDGRPMIQQFHSCVFFWRKQSSNSKRCICTAMFSAALFIMAKIWKQPKCPLIDEWIKKMWKYTHTHTHTCAHACVCVCVRVSQTCLWVFECLLQRHGSGVACCGDRVPGCSRPASHSLWHKPCWRRSPLAPS